MFNAYKVPTLPETAFLISAAHTAYKIRRIMISYYRGIHSWICRITLISASEMPSITGKSLKKKKNGPTIQESTVVQKS